jgi:predicted N-formylglutamate amidohydrolase
VHFVVENEHTERRMMQGILFAGREGAVRVGLKGVVGTTTAGVMHWRRSFANEAKAPWAPFELDERKSDKFAVVITAEHASMELPPREDGTALEWPKEDAWLLGTHWSYDIGSYDFGKELSAALGGVPSIYSRFSRLFLDPNRPLDSETLFRDVAEGKKIMLNAGLSEREKERRLALCYRPYHQALAELMRKEDEQKKVNVVVSVHSFTPLYEGQPRKVEIGVLFDRDSTIAEKVTAQLTKEGFDARLNEPWSGKVTALRQPSPASID